MVHHIYTAKWWQRETLMNLGSLQMSTFTQRSAVEASEILTWDSSLFHEVTHELWLCEEDVVELVHTELEDLVDVLPAIQILVEGLYFTCKSEKDTNIIRCAFTRLVTTITLLWAVTSINARTFCTFIVRFRGIAELGGDVFVVVEVQRGWGDGTTRPAGIVVLLFHQQWNG